MSVLIMAVYHMKESEFIDAFMSGMGDFLSVAIIVAVARGIQVIMNNGMITGTVLHGRIGPSWIITNDLYYFDLHFLYPNVILNSINVWSWLRQRWELSDQWDILRMFLVALLLLLIKQLQVGLTLLPQLRELLWEH